MTDVQQLKTYRFIQRYMHTFCG